jgi:hypothetical protein
VKIVTEALLNFFLALFFFFFFVMIVAEALFNIFFWGLILSFVKIVERPYFFFWGGGAFFHLGALGGRLSRIVEGPTLMTPTTIHLHSLVITFAGSSSITNKDNCTTGLWG